MKSLQSGMCITNTFLC